MWDDIINYMKNNILTIFFWLLAVILTIIQIRTSRRKKRLWFFEIYKNNLIDLKNTTIKNDLKISYKGKSVSKVGLYVFELKNIWNIIIEKDDFIEWRIFSVIFGWVNVIWVNLKSVYPEFLWNYDFILDYFENEVRIDPFTLDVWESIQIEVILDWIPESVSQWYRIKWIWSLTNNNIKSKQKKVMFFMMLSLLFYWVISTLNDKAMWNVKNYFDPDNFASIWYQILFYLSFLLIIISFAFSIRHIIRSKKYIDSDNNDSNLKRFIKKLLK